MEALIMTNLLNPRIGTFQSFYLNEKELQQLLKKSKQKKYGMLKREFEVEEVIVEVGFHRTCGAQNYIAPGNYFHVKMEYLVCD
jgi:hypothetical protein